LFALASKEFKPSDNGQYFVPIAKLAKPSKNARNPKLVEKLWDWTKAEMEGKGLLGDFSSALY
jgi:hypothetical protein